MSTTDRMPDLNSQRTIVDRVGRTVILGNAISAGAASIQAVMNTIPAGSSVNNGNASLAAVATLTGFNGSKGVWAVYWNPTPVALLAAAGGTIISAAVDSQTQATYSPDAN